MRVYTEATPRLIELHKNYKGNKFGNSDYAVWFDNTNTKDETGFFTATDGDSEDYWKLRNYTYLSEQEFIEFMELEGTVKDTVVSQVTDKYQERSKVGIDKYNTTLDQNTDGILTFLNHLQEELMDATLYIQKLKNQVEDLKNKL